MSGKPRGPLYTTFEANPEGLIIREGCGDPGRRTIFCRPGDAVTPERIASMLNQAFREGVEAKAEEIRNVLWVPRR